MANNGTVLDLKKEINSRMGYSVGYQKLLVEGDESPLRDEVMLAGITGSGFLKTFLIVEETDGGGIETHIVYGGLLTHTHTHIVMNCNIPSPCSHRDPRCPWKRPKTR
jgi:hypothetical protein